VSSRRRTRNKRASRPACSSRFSAPTVRARICVCALAGFFACAAFAAFYLHACRNRTAPKHAAKALTSRQPLSRSIDEKAATARLLNAMQRAGGSSIWIKKPAAGNNGLRGGDAGEVLAIPPAFEGLVSVARSESAKEGLEIRITEVPSPRRWRSVDLEILDANEPVCRWRLHEVAQIRRAAIIIDDLGADLSAAHQLLRLDYPLTFSVMPHLRNSTRVAEEAHRAGREVMLHLPMQPEANSPARRSPDELEVGMKSFAVRHIIESDLASVPHAAGVNNHMGSRATADAQLMAEVMQVFSECHLYFVDSRTTPDTVALEVARRMQVPAFYRSVFLDDTETTTYTLGQLRELRRVLEEQGTAIAIGHPHPTTISALAQFLPELEKDDIQLLPASRLTRLPEARRLWPQRSKPLQASNTATP
jgi:polysaccharide deacetylase 2 family uncharacterized protein YibQ